MNERQRGKDRHRRAAPPLRQPSRPNPLHSPQSLKQTLYGRCLQQGLLEIYPDNSPQESAFKVQTCLNLCNTLGSKQLAGGEVASQPERSTGPGPPQGMRHNPSNTNTNTNTNRSQYKNRLCGQVDLARRRRTDRSRRSTSDTNIANYKTTLFNGHAQCTLHDPTLLIYTCAVL